MSNKTDLEPMRHTLAHTLAAAVQLMYPKTRFGVGPATDDGFYYDLDPGVTLTAEDLAKIEAKMHELIKQDYKLERFDLKIDEAIKRYQAEKQPYKVELLKDLKTLGTTSQKDISTTDTGVDKLVGKVTTVSFYRLGKFEDLCRGPHLEKTSQAGPFKLMRVSGAYWRGDEANDQLQRIYGVAFATQKELDEHLKMLEEAEKRDHRKLGKELDLFTFSDLVGSGLPLWTPRGTILRREIDRFVQELRGADYQEVAIPHITKRNLYEKSGHWSKFSEELFRITTREGHEFAMKPMNCPHHTQIYASQQRSYRDLPIRYRETTMVYRDEQSGELGGLTRVRAITQDDAHVFCRKDQVADEVLKIWKIVESFYSAFKMPLRLRLSLHDPADTAAYMGDEKMWRELEGQLKKLADKKAKDYEVGIGEAAFYGPKLDFMAKDAIGREHQVATIQLDFNQPEGFDLTCINEKSEAERIVMIHAAIAGSFERFLSVLIEHFAGKFPLWLSPEQVRLATVNYTKKITEFAEKLKVEMERNGLRASIDDSNESVGKKIRSAELAKVPYTLVIGDKEAKSGRVTPRIRSGYGSDNPKELTIGQLITELVNEAQTRAPKSSF